MGNRKEDKSVSGWLRVIRYWSAMPWWPGQSVLCANTATMGRPTNRGPSSINVMTCVICENRHSTRATCPGTCGLYKHLHCQAPGWIFPAQAELDP